MNLLFHQMVKRKEELENLQRGIARKLENSPQGKLRVSNEQGIPRYYHVIGPKDTNGRYISKKNQELAYQLAQKDYMQRLEQKIWEELEDINMYLAKHDEDNLEHVFSNLNEYRRNIVTPLIITDEMFAQQWENELYETNPYYPEQKVYSTKKDELVRSKSEVLLADMYYELGIPYRYEAVLQLKNGKKKYPDFTLLKKKTREKIYHEHLGLLDDEEYRHANLNKLDEYQKNGIFFGKNLIITYEAEGCYLDIKTVKRMIFDIMQ